MAKIKHRSDHLFVQGTNDTAFNIWSCHYHEEEILNTQNAPHISPSQTMYWAFVVGAQKKTGRVSKGSTLTRFGRSVTTYKCYCNITIISSRSYNLARTVYPLNSLWPSDAIWRQGSGSILAQVMACCLTTPSHYLNQCWPIICGVLHHSHEVSSTGNAYESNHYNAFEN